MGGREQGQHDAGPLGDLSIVICISSSGSSHGSSAAMGRARGWEGDPDGLLGKVMGELRRELRHRACWSYRRSTGVKLTGFSRVFRSARTS